MDAVPECTRCGYDQSGVIATWKDACPIRLRCSECGLVFLCRDALNPEFVRQPRFYEHARNRYAASMLLTISKALRPWTFWRWVRMEHWMVDGRMLATALVGMALLQLATGPIRAAAVTVQRVRWPNSNLYLYWTGDLALGSIHYRPQEIGIFLPAFLHEMVPIPTAVGWLAVLLMPAAFLLLSDSLKAAKVHPRHLARIFAYSLVALPAVTCTAFVIVIGAEILAEWLRPPIPAMTPMMPGVPVVPIAPKGWSAGWSGPPLWLKLTPYASTPSLCWLWALVWWSVAAKHYLRLERPWLIGAVMTFVAALGACTACTVAYVLGIWRY